VRDASCPAPAQRSPPLWGTGAIGAHGIPPARGTATSVDVANVCVGLGEVDLAFDWPEQAVDERSLRFSIMEPQYGELHEHPRFQAPLERLGLPRG
jgi:hypothetical protein